MKLGNLFKEYGIEINEMAQSHIDNKVLKAIEDGDYAEAASLYIDNHSGSQKLAKSARATINNIKAGKISSALKADKEKVKEITDEQWDNFIKAYDQQVVGNKAQEKKPAVKRDAQDRPVTSRQSKESRSDRIKKLEQKIEKIATEYNKALKETEDSKTKEDLEEKLAGLQTLHDALQYTKKGTPVLPPKEEKELEDRYKKIGKTFVKRKGIDSEEEDKEMDSADEAQEELRQRITGILTREEDIWKKWLKQKRDLEQEKAKSSDVEYGVRNLKKREESFINSKGMLIAESLGYEGACFWENYIMSDLLRGFVIDSKELGEEATAEIYSDVFGEGTSPIFESFKENFSVLEAVANTKGNFLFETNGIQNLKESNLYEGPVMGILRGIWEKIKQFGAPIVNRLKMLIGKGFGWAKNIATKGIAWIANNPIARVAVPAVALAGGLVGAIKLINKIRKKKGMKELDKKEEQQLKKEARSKEDVLQKAGVNVENF